MRRISTLAGLPLALVVLAMTGLAACGSSGKAYVPVDSALRPWQAPEPAEPTGDGEPAAEPEPAPAAAPAK